MNAMSPRLRHWIARPGIIAGVAGGAWAILGACSNVVSPATTAWEGTLQPVPPGTVGGSVAVLSRSGSSDATIQISGGQSGATYRWQIRSGSCGVGGDIIGGTALYPVLSPNGSGESEANAALSRGLDAESEYAASVFRVAGESEELEACGELERLST